MLNLVSTPRYPIAAGRQSHCNDPSAKAGNLGSVRSSLESISWTKVLARLQLMVENRYLGLLTGEVGSSKSLLTRRLFQSLDPMRYLFIYISKSNLKPRGFYGELLRYVGEVSPFSPAKAKRLWVDVLESRQEQK